MDRRDFLKASLFAGSLLIPLDGTEAEGPPRVRAYRALGRTGLKMSDISMGTGKAPPPSLILRAIDRGINYFDTAPDYGPAEERFGEAMKRIRREKIIIASKFCNRGGYPKHLPKEAKKTDYIRAVEGSLKRLRTDYIDICFVHAIGESSRRLEEERQRLLSEEMLSAFETLKGQGKVRFLAVSSHGPHNMEPLLLEAIRSDHFDLIMTAFNFMKFPKLPEVIREAHRRGIGVVAMKTLASAKDMELKSDEEPFETAALKWVLKHREVSGLVITIKSIADLNLYLRASGRPFTSRDDRTLRKYATLYWREYCRTGCGACEDACPEGVASATILRYRMYFLDYGMEKAAMQAYQNLRQKAESCSTCSEPSCERVCPYGLPVKRLLAEADSLLRLNA